MGIQTLGKNLAVDASPRVRLHPVATRFRLGRPLWFSAGIALSVLISCLRFLNYHELPHLLFVARPPDAPNNSLLLQAASQGTDLRVTWNRSATAVTRARTGLLSIHDGDSSPRELRLDADQLRTGSLLYSAGSNKVQFSLQLFEPDGQNVSEYVLALSPLRMPVPGNDTEPTTSVGPTSIPPESLDSTSIGTDQLPARKARSEVVSRTPRSTEQNPPRATASASDLASGQVVRRIVPDVPQKARGTLQGTLRVRVRVRVDTSGSVTDAKFNSRGPSRYFGGLAMQAARHWKFDPPKSNGQAVSSEWALRFEFRRAGTRVFAERAAP
jgi:TonB family protein